jgi:ribosomal protein S5
MWPTVKGGGMNVPKPVFAVADCFGITDLRCKLIGRTNKVSQMRAIFNCFKGMRSLQDLARSRGRRVYEVRNVCPQYVRNI